MASCLHGEGSIGAGCFLLFPPTLFSVPGCAWSGQHTSVPFGVYFGHRGCQGRRPGDVDVMEFLLHIFAPQECCSQTHYITFSSSHIGVHVSPSLCLCGCSLYGCHHGPTWVLKPRSIRPRQQACLPPVSSAGSQTQEQSHREFICPVGSP